MILAIAKAFIESKDDYSNLEEKDIKSMIEIGRKYLKCGYGHSFYRWIVSNKQEPFGSFRNGSDMRIGSIGLLQ